MMRYITLFIFSLVFMGSVHSQSGISHATFDQLLRKYVDSRGLVNYKGLQSEHGKLRNYLEHIAARPPQTHWSDNEKLAYWINVYNAFTIDLVLKYYPIKSIKDIGSTIKIPFVNTPWDIKFIKIKEKTYDLNHIEHGIIRKQFDEPRIHFALVCAAKSCPKLLNRAYLPATLEAQLTEAARSFLADPTKNVINASSKATISKLFNWYKSDFTKRTNLAVYISQYTKVKLDSKAQLSFKDYDWSLNVQ